MVSGAPLGFVAPFDTVTIDESCTACGNCLLTCPTNVLIRAPKRPAVVDDLCTGCGLCIEVCPVDALHELYGITS